MWVTQGTTTLPTASPCRLHAEHHQAWRRWTRSQDSPGSTGVWVPHLISAQLLRVHVASPKTLLRQFRFLKELQQVTAVNPDPKSSPAPCFSVLTPSPFSPIPGQSVEFHKGSKCWRTHQPSISQNHRIVEAGQDLQSDH